MSEGSNSTVHITSHVELPQEVLDAHAEGRLVFFVGAGASVSEPSGLPLFKALAEHLADLARVPRPTENEQLDLFLGSMPSDFETHVHTHSLLSRPDSAPNSTHEAIIRIASAAGPLRIVTTNFDDHLAAAAARLDVVVPDLWIGPALPAGDEFEGIVHLHGSLRRGARELVLTDRDFGRAYLTRAWATRFLLPMFQKFTVAFVGYSHDDPLMRYLSLGLPSSTPRYAFTTAETVNAAKWRRLGVQTIGYPVAGHDHAALVNALDAWDARVRMGQGQHLSQMQAVVSSGTTLTPVDRDYLTGRLRTPDGIRDFESVVAKHSNLDKASWLVWLEGMPEFQALFEGREVSAAAAKLGQWYCSTYISSPELNGAALRTIQRLGQRFTTQLFRQACWAADELSRQDPQSGRRWATFLATSVYGHSAPIDAEALLSFAAEDLSDPLPVSRAILRPLLVLKPRWFGGDADDLGTPADAEVQWTASEYLLTARIPRILESAAPGDPIVGAVLEDSLHSAYELLDAYHGPRDWDPLAFGRSAIEQHEQDSMRHPIDAVIDGLRSYGEIAMEARPELSERWWEFGRPLFQRLALHLLAVNPARTADEKIDWLLDRSALYAFQTKHELFHVLAVSAAFASTRARGRLLAAAQRGPELPKGDSEQRNHAAYTRFNMLTWLNKQAPEWAEAAAALHDLQDQFPEYSPRPHPDFDVWHSVTDWSEKVPLPEEDFIQLVHDDPGEAVQKLLRHGSRDHSVFEPDWTDAVALLARAIKANPGVGVALWEVAAVNHAEGDDGQVQRLYAAIVEGWTNVDLGNHAPMVTALTLGMTKHVNCANAIGRFLLEQGRRALGSDETEALAIMRITARQLWGDQNEVFTHRDDADLTGFAPLFLNSWPGSLARFWLTEVERRWRQHRDDWTGLNKEEKDALIGLLSGSPDSLDATRPAIANQLFFLFSADSEFATSYVLPLFSNDVTSSLVWSAFLHHPRYNDKLLAAGLLEGVKVQFDRLSELSDVDMRRNFLGLTASIISLAGITPEVRQDLLDRGVLAEQGAHAVEFARAMTRFVEDDTVDGSEIWKRWLGRHIESRLVGIPRTASQEELAKWADVVPLVGQRIPEAIAMLSGHGIGFGSGHIRLSEDAVTNQLSELVPHWAERLRNSTPNMVLARQIRTLVGKLRESTSDETIKPLLEAAGAWDLFKDRPL